MYSCTHSNLLFIVYTIAVVGFETPNKYTILNSNGEIIFQAVEGEFVLLSVGFDSYMKGVLYVVPAAVECMFILHKHLFCMLI